VAAGAPLALATGKRLVDRGLGMDLAAAISYEGKQVHSFLATSGPVMRASSGKVAAMMPRDTMIPPAVRR
jgi:hypothetical protein